MTIRLILQSQLQCIHEQLTNNLFQLIPRRLVTTCRALFNVALTRIKLSWDSNYTQCLISPLECSRMQTTDEKRYAAITQWRRGSFKRSETCRAAPVAQLEQVFANHRYWSEDGDRGWYLQLSSTWFVCILILYSGGQVASITPAGH